MAMMGTINADGVIIHNTHSRHIVFGSFEYDCLVAGEYLPKKWQKGEVVEWEFLEKQEELK